MNEVPRTFRLHKYQITVAASDELSWQAYGGMERIIDGQCIMESDVLFIGSQEYEKEDSSKQEFLT